MDMAPEQNPAPLQCWDWLDDDLKLDLDTPLVASPSFWDDLGECNDSVVRSLFACSNGDDAFPCGKKGDQQISQNRTPYDEVECNSPRLSAFEHCTSSFINTCDDRDLSHVHTSPSSMWIMANEEPYINSTPTNSVEQSTENWMAGCNPDDADSDIYGAGHHLTHEVNVGPSQQAEDLAWRNGQSNATDQVGLQRHGIKRKHGYQTSTGGWKPVVLPFALVKPCGIQGDTTLKDINQRINMASPSRILAEPSDRISGSSMYSPLSGKSVLAVTKIHTEGKGSITIMRTKG